MKEYPLKDRKRLEKLGFKSLVDKDGKLYKNLAPKGISQCQCDCMVRTCSHCFISGLIKPWCDVCHTDVNDGRCKCDKPTTYNKQGWADNTKYIVKHTPAEKTIIRGWIKKHNDMLKQSDHLYDTIWQGNECRDCGKSFKVRGGKIDTCKECTLKILNDSDMYSEK